MRIRAAHKTDIRCEHIDAWERVTEAASCMPVVVPQEAVVLTKQFRCDLTREFQARGWQARERWSSKS